MERIMSTSEDLTAQLQWPVRQLAHACSLAGAHYGYIQTEEDLTVCKFTSTTGQMSAQITTISWTNAGPNDLTTDLGLWWLCILALEDHQNMANPEGTGTGGGEMPITTQTATNPDFWIPNAAPPFTVPPANSNADSLANNTLPNLGAANDNLVDMIDFLTIHRR